MIKVLAWGYSPVAELLPYKLKALGSISITANCPSSVHSRPWDRGRPCQMSLWRSSWHLRVILWRQNCVGASHLPCFLVTWNVERSCLTAAGHSWGLCSVTWTSDVSPAPPPRKHVSGVEFDMLRLCNLTYSKGSSIFYFYANFLKQNSWFSSLPL